MEIGKITGILLIVITVIVLLVILAPFLIKLVKPYLGWDIDYQTNQEKIDNLQLQEFNAFVDLFNKCREFEEYDCLCSSAFKLEKDYLLKIANVEGDNNVKSGVKIWLEGVDKRIIGEPKIIRYNKASVCTNERNTKAANVIDLWYVDYEGNVFTDNEQEYLAEGIKNGGAITLFKTISGNLCIVTEPVGNPVRNEKVEFCKK